MGLVVKAVLGALVALLTGVLAKTKNYYTAELILFLSIFALIVHYIVVNERGIKVLRVTVIFSIWSIISYSVYLAPLWHLTGMMRLPAAFVGPVACWGISAWVLTICWTKLH